MWKILKKTLRMGWRYSPVLTIPICVVYLYWLSHLGVRYYELSLRYGDAPDMPDLYSAGVYEAERIKAAGRTALLESSADEGGKLSKVHLMVNQGEIGKLNSHLPASGRIYKDGFLIYPDGSTEKVDVRYRGDFGWHWGTHKKSWRVKTSRNRLWNNMRAFNLIVPKGLGVIEDDLGYWLAREMGLLAPSSELVEVILNGENQGVYTQVEQLEELVLRKNNRMPGDLFAGELIGRDAHFGISNMVFDHPHMWEKISINNHFEPGENAALVDLCRLISQPLTESSSAELAQILDLEAFGKFAAYRVLTQSKHFDRTHNWRLYYDPWKCRFEPVVWDTVPWTPDWLPAPGADPFHEPLFNRLDTALVQMHSYRLAMHRSLREFFTEGLDDRLLQEYDRLVSNSAAEVQRDPVLTNKLVYRTPDEVRKHQVELRARISELFRNLEESHAEQPPMLAHTPQTIEGRNGSMRLAIYGRRAIEGIQIEYQEPLDSVPEVHFAFQQNGESRRRDLTSNCRIQGRVLEVDIPLVGGMSLVKNLTHDVFHLWRPVLSMSVFDVDLKYGDGERLQPLRVFAMTGDGARVPVHAVEQIQPAPMDGQFEVIPRNKPAEALQWSGDIVLNGQQFIRQDLVIQPGTTIRMAPEASVVIEGAVLAIGTEEEPIRVLPREGQTVPWGTFAIRGPAADGSSFRHVQFAGGSGWKQPKAEFSSMFSIHWVQEVEVLDCIFADSHIVDDMVHGVYSDVLFERCTFSRSLADALDMDISVVKIKGCLFEDSGNDSVDLMTASAVVEDTVFVNSEDKGISIGENSTLFVGNSVFDSCNIALQSKDESQAAIVNADIFNCNWGVDAYKKNWRYNGGGEIYVYKSRLFDNDVSVRADKHSIVGLSDCSLRGAPVGESDQILFGAGMEQGNSDKAALKPGVPYRFEGDLQALQAIGRTQWMGVQESRRGSSLLSNQPEGN